VAFCRDARHAVYSSFGLERRFSPYLSQETFVEPFRSFSHRFARRWRVARRGAGRPAHRADHRERVATAESTTRTGKQPATIERPIWRARLGNDLAPAAEFLAAKLASHTLLGALMGALGGAAQLSVGVRTSLHIGPVY
jgi:hypothetical protein